MSSENAPSSVRLIQQLIQSNSEQALTLNCLLAEITAVEEHNRQLFKENADLKKTIISQNDSIQHLKRSNIVLMDDNTTLRKVKNALQNRNVSLAEETLATKHSLEALKNDIPKIIRDSICPNKINESRKREIEDLINGSRKREIEDLINESRKRENEDLINEIERPKKEHVATNGEKEVLVKENTSLKEGDEGLLQSYIALTQESRLLKEKLRNERSTARIRASEKIELKSLRKKVQSMGDNIERIKLENSQLVNDSRERKRLKDANILLEHDNTMLTQRNATLFEDIRRLSQHSTSEVVGLGKERWQLYKARMGPSGN